jgi:phosphate acetyltransferase
MKNHKYFTNLFERSISSNANILLPEADDVRIIEAKKKLKDLGFNILDINDFADDKKYIDFISSKKFTKNWPIIEIKKYLEDPVNKALCVLACKQVDGVIAGASRSTAEIIRSALRVVGIDPSYKWISSAFIMMSPDKKNIFTYSDCAVIPEPSSEQLAYIAKAASDIHTLVTSQKPKVAFLSFSTNGSASHYRVNKVKDAVEIFSKRFPNIEYEGEIQFDAAISEEISKNKNVNSKLKGDANIFIFPNLDAGNISYKITRELAGYSAWGPLIQGLNRPVHDLSRGCSVEDIINIAAITAIQKPS